MVITGGGGGGGGGGGEFGHGFRERSKFSLIRYSFGRKRENKAKRQPNVRCVLFVSALRHLEASIRTISQFNGLGMSFFFCTKTLLGKVVSAAQTTKLQYRKISFTVIRRLFRFGSSEKV